MRSAESNLSTEIDQSLERDLGANIRALKRTNGAFHSADSEMSGDNLGALLRRVSDASTREIESLIDELHALRKTLESHGERIQSDIARYAELSQGVMQLTVIISDNVKRLPSGALDVSR
jgi:hypothetical protein